MKTLNQELVKVAKAVIICNRCSLVHYNPSTKYCGVCGCTKVTVIK